MPADHSLPLSVIVPTFNRAVHLQATVTQLLGQAFTDYELWIIDQSDPADAASNRAYAEGLGDARVSYRHVSRRSLPNARNVGLAAARGRIVLFVDDDVILLSDGFIDAHLRCYEDARVGGVTGRHIERVMLANSRSTACHVSLGGRTIFNLFGRRRQAIGSCKGSNMSFRMAAVDQVGGFDRRTHMLEDTDFSVRVGQAGWRLLFEPEAEVVHLSTPSGGVRESTGITTERRRFRSTAYYVGKHRGVVGMACFLATFSVIALLRTVRFRSLGTIPVLVGAIRLGFAEARLGPDQVILPGPEAAVPAA